MAFMIKEIIDLKRILLLMLLTIPSQATNLDCNGKAFYCLNSTHFMICVDLGRGISTTIDEIIIPCPSPTVCRQTNRYECEFPVPLVLEPEVSTIENALTIDSEATTFVPYVTTSIPFEEYFNTLSTTTVSENELQSFTTDSSLGVESNTVRLDINVSTAKIVLEENAKSETRNINLANSVKPNDTNSNKVENNVTLNLNVIPFDETTPANNNQGFTTIIDVTQVTDLPILNINLQNVTSVDIPTVVTEQTVTTEKIFPKKIRQPSMDASTNNITSANLVITTENVFTSDVQKPTVIETATDTTSAVPKNTVTIEELFTKVSQQPPKNATATDINSTINNQSVTTEKIFTTDVQEPTVNIIAVGIPDTVTESTNTIKVFLKPWVNARATDIASAVTEHELAVTSEEVITDLRQPSLNEIRTERTSTINKQTEAIQVELIKDFREPAVNRIATDITNAVTEHTLTTQKLLTKQLGESLVNSTLTDIISKQTLPNEGLLSKLNALQKPSVNATADKTTTVLEPTVITEGLFTKDFQLSSINVTATDITSDIDNETTTEKVLINIFQDRAGNLITTGTISAVTKNTVTTEELITKELRHPLIDMTSTDTIYYNNQTITEKVFTKKFQELPTNVTPTIITRNYKEQTVTSKRLTKGFEKLSESATISENFFIAPDTNLTSITVEHTQKVRDNINSSALLKNIDNGSVSNAKNDMETTNNSVLVEDEFDTREMKSSILNSDNNNTDNITSSNNATTKTTVAGVQENNFYNQKPPRAATTTAHFKYFASTPKSVITAELITEDNNVANATNLKTEIMVDTKVSLTDVSVTLGDQSNNISNDSVFNNSNEIINLITLVLPNNAKIATKNESNQELSQSKEQDSFTDSSVSNSGGKRVETEALTDVDTTTVATTTIEIVKKDILTSTKNSTTGVASPTKTTKPNTVTELGNTILGNQLETFTNSKAIALTPTYTPGLYLSEQITTTGIAVHDKKVIKENENLDSLKKTFSHTVNVAHNGTLSTSPLISNISETSLPRLVFMNQIHGNHTTQKSKDDSYFANSDARIETISMPSTTIRSATDNSYADSLSALTEHTDFAIELDQNKLTAIADEIVTLTSPIPIVDKDTISSTEYNKLQSQAYTVPMDISTSSSSSEITKLEVSNILPYYNMLAEKTQSSIYTVQSPDNLQDVSTSHQDVSLIASTFVEAKTNCSKINEVSVKNHVDPRVNANESNTHTSNDPNLALLSVTSNSNVERSILPTATVAGNRADMMVAVTTYEKDFIEEPKSTTSSISTLTSSSIESVTFTIQVTTPINDMKADLSKQNDKSSPISTNSNSVSPLVTKSIETETRQMITATQSFEIPQKSLHYTQNKDLSSNTAHVLEDTAVKSLVGNENSFITPKTLLANTTKTKSINTIEISTNVDKLSLSGPKTSSSYVDSKQESLALGPFKATITDSFNPYHLGPMHTTDLVKKDLSKTLGDAQVLKDDMTTEKDLYIGVATPNAEQKLETLKRDAKFNFNISNPDKRSVNISSKISIVPTVQNSIKEIGKNAQQNSSQTTLSTSLPDLRVATKVITRSDLLIDENMENEQTHSGIISFLTSPPNHRDTKEKKESEVKEIPENPEHKDPDTLSEKVTSTPPKDILITLLKNNNIELQNYNSTRQNMQMKTENNDFKSIIHSVTIEKSSLKKPNLDKNSDKSTSTVGSENKNKPPTKHELVENNTASTINSHTSNNKSKDQNKSTLYAHNMIVISNDQSSTSRYMSNTNITAAGDTQTAGFPAFESTTPKTKTNKFSCAQKKRGRYADELNCRKFYICLGNTHVVEGMCPVNTVFSEIRKQCTNNLSQCIRNNQFRCVTEGHFSDFLNDNVYYICVKKNETSFIRFKLMCQNGYHLNKTTVRCVLNNESKQSSSNSDSSKTNSDQSASLTKTEEKEIPEKKFKCKKEGIFADPSNCKRYIECTKSDTTVYRQKRKKCDSGEIFHRDKKKCVDSDSYEC